MTIEDHNWDDPPAGEKPAMALPKWLLVVMIGIFVLCTWEIGRVIDWLTS
jgi:hypothetical protein